MSLCILGRQAPRWRRRLHALLDALGREDAVAGGLARRRRRAVVEARIKGSGAGMEPPEGAGLEDGWWVYMPAIPPLPRLVLAASGATAAAGPVREGECVEVGASYAAEPVSSSNREALTYWKPGVVRPGLAAGAGRPRAAHVVALRPIGRGRIEFAQGESKMRKVVPERHRLKPCISDVPSD